MKPNDKAYREFMRVYNKTHVSLEAQIMASLTAAYAAQFKSEDYAELVKELRAECRDWLTADCVKKAADALEALLADRDALKAANNELREENELVGKQMDRFADQIEALEAERDALAARLAPVDDDALVEIVGRTLRAEVFDPDVLKVYGDLWAYDEQRKILKQARAALAAIRPHIEAAERERCAKIAEEGEDGSCWTASERSIAAAIRSGK